MPEVIASTPTLDDAAPAAGVAACAVCGAPVEAGDKFCGFCGSAQPEPATGEGTGGGAAPRFFRCENCGAQVAVDTEHRSYTCAFCDSNYVVEFTPEQSGRQPPEFVIGFAVPPEQARQRFRQWLGRYPWFRPGDLQLAQIEGKLRGAYVPFWSFSMLAQSRWSAEIGEYWYTTETYTTTVNGKTVTRTRRVRHTEWWDLAGRHHQYYSGYLISGSRGLSQGDCRWIQPFHLAGLKRYQPYFLAGWLSEEYSVGRDEALTLCRQVFGDWEAENVKRFLPGDTYGNLQVQTAFDQINSDLILLPIYVLSYRYRDKLYRFLVNGQTGKVVGQKPLSWSKIALAAGLGVLLVVLMVLLIHWFMR
ncbi:MAG: zinc ribbon domain-containing protein [Pirellulales bacterium]|nr:zinc ribbon domain-containing protein [Pirellulales bacterium]